MRAGQSPRWHVLHDSLYFKYFARISLCDENNAYLDEWEMDTEITCRDECTTMVTFAQAGPRSSYHGAPFRAWLAVGAYQILGLWGQVTKVLIQAQACSCRLSLGKSYHCYKLQFACLWRER